MTQVSQEEPLPVDFRASASKQLAAILEVLGLLQRQIAPSRPELADDIAALAAHAERLRRMLVSGVA